MANAPRPDDDADRAVREGLGWHQQGELARAEQYYRQALASAPQHAEALRLLGLVLLQRGQVEAAVALLERAVALRPEAALARANLAYACLRRGQAHAALEQAAVAVRLEPGRADYRNTLGMALAALGRWADAEQHLAEAVRLRPDFALARNNLGVALHELGRDRDAIDAFRAAVAAAPGLASAHSHLGQLLLEHHEIDEALVHSQEAVRLDPALPEALNNLGNVLRELGRLDEAKDCYHGVLRTQPRQAMAYNNLGQALQEEGRWDEALACYRRALEEAPDTARFLCNLATLHAQREQGDEALRLCQAALAQEPDCVQGWLLLGDLRAEQGDQGAAEACYRRALQIQPDHALAFGGLGRLCELQGELEQSRDYYRQALRRNPRQAGALAALAISLRGRLPPEELALGLRLLDAPLAATARATLQYGLAKTLDGIGRYDEAAALLRQANAERAAWLVRCGRLYDPDQHERLVTGLIASFDADFFQRVHGWGVNDETPVFVVGLPRSGTTLTEQILAGHPRVFAAGELPDVPRLFRNLPGLLDCRLAPEECARSYQQAVLHRAAEEHLHRLRTAAPGAERVVDKMPDNYLYLGLIAALWPQARIIHVRREVRDVALSCWMTHFKQIDWACDLTHIALRIQAYRRVMAHWRCVLPARLLEIDYEEMVRDLEPCARRLVAFCGLDWDPACLAFHAVKRPVRTASVVAVREPVHGRSVGRWQHYAAALGPVIQVLDPPR